jgi:arylsulfatase A-like enzyme
MRKTTDSIRTILTACLGGAWGGALVGLTEAGLITLTSAPGEEYWLFSYAMVSYGLLGALLGFGYGAVSVVSSRVARGTFPVPAALAVLLLGGAVTRYQVVQRVFHEELITLSVTGAVVHIGVVVFVAACAVVVLRAGRVLQMRPHGLLIGMVGFLACLALSSVAAVLASPHATGAALSRSASPAAKDHPNVILIIADTLRADVLGVFGAGPHATPGLDRFAGDAVRFMNTYSQSTWTRPSIATILTSLYPSVHGTMHKMDAMPDDVTTLAEAFRAKGYWTAGFVSNINVAPVFNFQQGFDEYTYLPPNFYFGASDSAARLAIYKGLRVLHERFFRQRIYFYHYYQDANIVDAAVLQWLEQRPPTPFFLLIHYMDPHDPYFEHPYNGHGVARVIDPDPAPARKNELRALYTRDVAYLDQYLDHLFSQLKALGLYDESVIVLTADHGEEFQDHGGWWHGTSLYQEQVHVPLLVKRAREPRAGAAESRIARSLDIAPTVMAAAGLTIPASFEGRDLFAAPAPESEPLFAEEDFEGNVLASLRVGAWKVITANPANPRGLKPVELYNLSEDPNERHDRSADEPARAQEMVGLLAHERARITAQSELGGAPKLSDVADHRS